MSVWVAGISAAASVGSAYFSSQSGGGGGGGQIIESPQDARNRAIIAAESAGDIDNITRRRTLANNDAIRGAELEQAGRFANQAFNITNPLLNRYLDADANSDRIWNTRRREAEMADIQAQGPGLRAEWDRMNEPLFDEIEQQQTDTPIRGRINDQAFNDLGNIPIIDDIFIQDENRLRGLQDVAAADVARNGRLSPEALRDAQQYSRQGDEARGMFRSSVSGSNEILNTESARKQNLAFADQRLAGMQGLLGQNEGRMLTMRNNMRASGESAQAGSFAEGQQRIDNRLSTFFNPATEILGRQGGQMGNSSNNTNTFLMNNEQGVGYNSINNTMSTLFADGSSQRNASLNANAANSGANNAGYLDLFGGLLNQWQAGRSSGGGGGGGGNWWDTPGING